MEDDKEMLLILRQQLHEACQDVDRLTLRWTTTRPTVPGQYWYRGTQEGSRRARVVEVWQSTIHQQVLKASYLGEVRDINGEWAGPLPEPVAAPEPTGGEG